MHGQTRVTNIKQEIPDGDETLMIPPPLPPGMISPSAVASLLQFVKSDPQMLAKFGKLNGGVEYPSPTTPLVPLSTLGAPPSGLPPNGLPLASQVWIYTVHRF